MFASGHLLTQLIPFFYLQKFKMFWKFGDFIDLDPAEIRIRIDQILWILIRIRIQSIRIHITDFNKEL